MDYNHNSLDGSGYQKDSRAWKLLDIHKKTDHRGRVYVGDPYFNMEIAVFVSDTDQDLEICENYYILPYILYKEVRKSRKKSERGDPLRVQKSGDVYTTCGNKYVKIFVKVA
jgi:hypothetical protein